MDKVACDKAVGERWCVTKLCVSDGAWKSGVCARLCVSVANGVWQMTCDAWLANLCLIDGVWPRLCLPKLCVFERCRDRLFMWQKCERWCETEMVCDRVVGEKCCLCVNDGVWQSWAWQRACDKGVCERGGEGVWQRYDRSSGATNRRKLCVKICCGTKNVWQTKCVTKLREKKRWDKDGVWLRWRLTKII